MSGDELDAEDAWHTVRRHGVGRLVVDSFARFRFGDGFTNSRALALQFALAVVPFMIGLTGLAASIDAEREAKLLARTIGQISPGSRGSDVLSSALSPDSAAGRAGDLVLVLGLAFALVSMTLAMAQIERGANRIYGIGRDRHGLAKYTRAAVLTALLALPVGLGFLLLIAGGPFGDAMQSIYGWSGAMETVWDVVRWPIGLVVTTLAITIVLERSPHRHQPQLSWLALGAGAAVLLTMAASGLLAIYVNFSGSFGSVYGPLTGVIALLLWCNLTSASLFYGIAMAAQLEALRAGLPDPTVNGSAQNTETEPARQEVYGRSHD